jgi:hypothetical protein
MLSVTAYPSGTLRPKICVSYGVVGSGTVPPLVAPGTWNHFIVMVVDPGPCPGSTSWLAVA